MYDLQYGGPQSFVRSGEYTGRVYGNPIRTGVDIVASLGLLDVELRQVPLFTLWDDSEVQEEERNIQKNGAKEGQPEPEIFQGDPFPLEIFANPTPILRNRASERDKLVP